MSSHINVITFRNQDHHFRWPVHLIHLLTRLYTPLRQYWHMYYRQLQQVLLISTDATCLERVDRPQTLKYTTLNKTYVKMHGRLATGWTVRGSNPSGGELFRTCPDRPWGPSSLLYNGYRVFPGGKERPGRDADPSPPSSAVVMKG